VKLKIGRDLARELDVISALRATFGDRIALRLDANQSFSSEDANRAMRALEPFAPELLEEPSAEWDRLQPRIPLALDESLIAMQPERVRGLAARGIVSALILKPMALGGFSRCLALARLAEELGLAISVTHLFDGPIALAAAAELALALPGRLLPCGLDRHAGLGAWPPIAVPQLKDAELVPHEGAGLGVEVAA
jgi:L-alanine-DL-glutamate epimerase-like enolase superfamily enzyme